jgi:hypothetical protein
MNNFIKQVIEETFASKAQQRFFYAKANEKGSSKKEKSKWSKMANEFSSKTDFSKIPEKKEEINDETQFDEIVDANGNIQRSKKPSNLDTKGVTQKKTTDDVVKSTTGSMGTFAVGGVQNYRKYWGESDMSKSLGYDDTMGKDQDYDDAEDHFEKELGLDDTEAEKRLNQMGYDKNLPKDKVRLVENPKKYLEDFIETVLRNKTTENDVISKEIKEINPIVKKQIKSLKHSMTNNGLSIDDIINHLKDDE